jgi:hypothetical protein
MPPTEPVAAITSPDNQVPQHVDAALTALLDRTVSRRGIQHLTVGISPTTAAVCTERANLLRNMPPNRYGLGTWIFRVNRLIGPGRRPSR